MFKKEQQYTIKAHNNEFGHLRSFNMYVKSPDQGINEQTGVLLVVQNLRAVANSQFWYDLRSNWSNRYNVITIGLNYQGAGWTGKGGSGEYTIPLETLEKIFYLLPEEIRPATLPSNPDDLLKLFAGQDLTPFGIQFDEAEGLDFWKNYPDYGFIQAMDCLWALGALKQILTSEGVSINQSRTYAYGINEGGHIVQMCGRFAPRTFALIIDNSGYPFITIETMLGKEDTYEKRWLSVGNSSIGVNVSLPKTYGIREGARYYVTEDMLEIRNLNQFIVDSPTRFVVIQMEKDNPDKRKLYEEMVKGGLDVNYVVREENLNEENVVSLFEEYADHFISTDSPDMLSSSGLSDFELATRMEFDTTNGKYILDYSSGAPQIEFEGNIVVLRLADEDNAGAEEINVNESNPKLN
ncbi:MAG: DUF2920 family protein [Chitinophagales bacterium]